MAWKRYRKHAQSEGLPFDPDNEDDMEVARAWWAQQPESKQFESVMKITKNQLKRIIKEEKAKLLNENNPIANAERMQGTYSDVSAIDAVENALSDLLAGTNQDAFEDLQDEDDADDASTAAVTLTVAQAFQSLGLMAQYEALIRTLR